MAPSTSVGGHLRCAAPRLAATELTSANFLEAVDDFDGLVVVRFHAPWCRTCRSTAPAYKSVTSQVAAAHDNVRFFEVNFKENKALCLQERVFALPTIHFYARPLGRINRFTLSPRDAQKRVRYEIERYVGSGDEESRGHLAFLQSLQASASTSGSAASPLVRFKGLVGLLDALEHADAYLATALSGENKDGALLTRLLDEDPRRVEELEQLFSWIDSNGDGVIDADELEAVAAAVGSLSERDGLRDFWASLLTQARSSVARYAAGAAEDAGAEGTPSAAAADGATETPAEDVTAAATAAAAGLDLASFVRLMTSKAVSDFKEPEGELRPAFDALDADGNGEVTRDEFVAAMRSVCSFLPTADAASYLDSVEVAFDALDVDRSGTLDYEEFVAVLSGVTSASFRDEQ